jgi:hypothetical protein
MTRQDTINDGMQGMIEAEVVPVTGADVKAAWIVVAALFTALFLLV